MNVCRISRSPTSRSDVDDLCKTNKMSQSAARGGGMHESSKRTGRNGSRSSIMFNAANKRLECKVRTSSAVIIVLTTINGNAAYIFLHLDILDDVVLNGYQ